MTSTSATFDEPGVLRGDELVPMAEIRRRAARAAAALASVGVGAGDTIAVLMRNDIPFVEASLAASILGAASVPVNWHGRSDEVGYVLRDSGTKALVVHADLLAGIRDAVPDGVVVRVVPTPDDVATTYGLDPATTSVVAGDVAWADWIAGFDPYDGAPAAQPNVLIYTSGTTGAPKGVRRLPSSEQATATPGASPIGLVPGMRTVITGPMYHTAPNTYALAAVMLDGFVVLQPRFDGEELLALVERHRITHLHMVPTMFVRMLRLPGEVRARYDLSSLQNVVHAAAPCPPDVKRQMIEWLGPIVNEYYGGTETGAVVACTSAEWLAHPGTVGKAAEHCVVKVVDADGHELPAGEIGEVYMRNHAFPDFVYEGRPDARRDVELDGLFTCGDVGYLDEDGFLYLCDRRRDMVISGGVNIYPAEIEACLLQLAGVRDVAVFGAPHDEFGEQLVAAVEREDGATVSEDDVRRHVAEHLAAFKAPRIVTFHESLPREDSGKIFKRKLRAPYWESAGRNI